MPRGRPPAHTRVQVVDAAIAVADAEGLAAVTMRRIATEIGAGAMSLYTYVPDKDRLVDLMVDRVGGLVALRPATGDWQADLLALTGAQRALMIAHPWLPSALPNRRLTGTNTLAYLEFGLAALAPTGLSGPAKMEVLALLTGFVASYVANELAQSQSAVTVAEQVEHLVAAVSSGDFPHLAAVLAASSGERAAAPDFERIAARMIVGLVGIDQA
jgi:AcrR family transcriptional regulator